MNQFERDLATALKFSAPPPPVNIDPESMTRGNSGVRLRSVAAPLAVAIVVAAVVAGVVGVVRSSGGQKSATASQSATQGPPQPQPQDLFGTWTLTSLVGLDGASHTKPDLPITFRFKSSGVINQSCSTAVATIGPGTIKFVQEFITTTQATGCERVGGAQAQFLFGKVLVGTARWTIRNDELIVSRDALAAVFSRSSSPTSRPKITAQPTPSGGSR